MFRHGYKLIVGALFSGAIWLLIPGDDAHSFSSGAPAGYCNSPANPGSTCFTCHNTGPTPITLPGMITSNIPVNGYTPGNTYTITATVNGAGHNRFGFEISPQDPSGNLVGSMNDLGTETIFQQSGVYITHSSNSLLNNDFKTWQFEWTAPAAGSGSVTFYGAFNISNNDGSYTGDTILLSTAIFPEDSGLFVNSIAANAIATSAFFAEGMLHVRNVAPKSKRIQVIDHTGRTIWESGEIYSAYFQPEIQFVLPASLSSGVYIVSIVTDNKTWSSKITTIK